jgi:hypothetical protein
VSDPALELPPGERLVIAEHAVEGGVLERTLLVSRDATPLLAIVRGNDVKALKELPVGAIDGVMRRYGKPLADEVSEPAPQLRLAGATLSTFRHLARYDVIARDYVYYRPDSEEPGVAAVSATVGAALRFLARL